MNPEEKPENYWEGQPDEAEPEQLEDEQPDQSVSDQTTPQSAPVTWSAQEYIPPDKSPLWFVIFVIVVLGLIAFDVFLLKSWTFSALVVVMAISLIIITRRPPRTISYSLSPAQGLTIGERLYHFDQFKTFGVIKDGEHNTIMLIPTRRFAPAVSVYFPEEAGEQIVDIFGQHLPIENLKLDIVDVVVRKLRL